MSRASAMKRSVVRAGQVRVRADEQLRREEPGFVAVA